MMPRFFVSFRPVVKSRATPWRSVTLPPASSTIRDPAAWSQIVSTFILFRAFDIALLCRSVLRFLANKIPLGHLLEKGGGQWCLCYFPPRSPSEKGDVKGFESGIRHR